MKTYQNADRRLQRAARTQFYFETMLFRKDHRADRDRILGRQHLQIDGMLFQSLPELEDGDFHLIFVTRCHGKRAKVPDTVLQSHFI
jgi:hypothetical protein